MKPWKYWVDGEVVVAMAAMSRPSWQILLAAFDRIREQPFTGNVSVEDVHGRWMFLRAHGPFVVSYHEDHPVRSLMIVSVCRVRRRR